ncbi:MAG: sugar phosphate isomerase/epimerase family protein [Thermoplasmata archaeon]
MQLAFSNAVMPYTEAEVILEQIAGKFKRWEIAAELNFYLPENEKKLSSLLSSYDIRPQIHAPFSDINPASLYPKAREFAWETIRKCIESASGMNASPVTFHPGTLSPMGEKVSEKVLQYNAMFVRQVARWSEEYSVTCLLENMPDMKILLMKSPSEMYPLLDETGLKMCLDLGHANTLHNIDSWLSDNGRIERISNIHAHDNMGSRDEHLAVGEGSIGWKNIKKRLCASNHIWTLEVKSFEDALSSKKLLENLDV